jgi:hypothetical protein
VLSLFERHVRLKKARPINHSNLWFILSEGQCGKKTFVMLLGIKLDSKI